MPSNHLILCHSLQSFPASGSFQMSRLFASGGQSIGASASASVLPMNIQGWFPSGLTGLISLQSKELSRVFSGTTVGKHQFFSAQPSLWSNSYICLYTTKGKTTTLTIWTVLPKWKLCFLICCPGFFPFMAAVTVRSDFGAQGKKICHCLHCFPFYLPWSDGTGCHDLGFFNVESSASFFTLSPHPLLASYSHWCHRIHFDQWRPPRTGQ